MRAYDVMTVQDGEGIENKDMVPLKVSESSMALRLTVNFSPGGDRAALDSQDRQGRLRFWSAFLK